MRRHSLHAIAGQLSPAPACTGIEALFADRFTLHCFQTLTGTKLLMVVEPDTPDVEDILRTMCARAVPWFRAQGPVPGVASNGDPVEPFESVEWASGVLKP